MVMEPMQVKLASSQFDLGHTNRFGVREVIFDWENAIALHAMQGNRASSCGEGEVSWVFSICGRHLGYILELRRGCPF